MKLDPSTGQSRALFERLHIDLPLLIGILAVFGFALMVMYSASGQSMAMIDRQAMRMVLALTVMIGLAQISPRTYESLAPCSILQALFYCWACSFSENPPKGHSAG